MQSHQEDVLEEFMQRSFGAQFIFAPKKFRKGNSSREPSDLAWVSPDLVALFYLRSSNESLIDQVFHNTRQARGYIRLWSTKRTVYALRGVNRFGDETFTPYNEDGKIIVFSVVSSKCGIHYAPSAAVSDAIPAIVLPENLIHWVADFGGTILDLLNLVRLQLQQNEDLEVVQSEHGLRTLEGLVHQYVRDATEEADPEGRYLSGHPLSDYNLILSHLNVMKMPHSSSGITDRSGREFFGALFGDLALREFLLLGASVERAIKESNPPNFTNPTILRVDGIHQPFVISTFNSSGVSEEYTEKVAQAGKNSDGILDAIVLQYGDLKGLNDYRSPVAIWTPPILAANKSASQLENLLEEFKTSNLL